MTDRAPTADFNIACDRLVELGFRIVHAQYDGKHFGSWYIDFVGDARTLRTLILGHPRRRLIYDARDRWLMLRDAAEKDLWIGREPASALEEGFAFITETLL